MADRPALDHQPDQLPWMLFTLIVLGVVLLSFPLVTGGGVVWYLVMKDRPLLKVITWGLALLGAFWFVLKLPLTYLYPLKELKHTLLLSAPMIPLGATLVEPFQRLRMFLKPRSLQEQIKEEQHKLAERDRQLHQSARQQEKSGIVERSEYLRLGVFLRGDTFPNHLNVTKHGRWLLLHEDLLDQHMFVLGTTGAGKSETIKRLIFEILTNTNRDLFFVDGKGDEGLAQEVRAMCYHAKPSRGNTPIFRMGLKKKGYPYNGFSGEAGDIYNRLAAMVRVGEAEGNAQYYADINRDLLQLICYSPEGVPRSLKEVRSRLNKDWLQSAWRNDPEEVETIKSLGEKELSGLRWRLRPLVRELSQIVTPEGFTLEESRSAIFAIRTQSVTDSAQRFLHFLVEDLKDFAGKRQQRPGVLIIDEFGAFGNENIVALLTLARSAKLGVILATQDIASLGDEATTRLILANTRTKILMATDFPEEVAKLAGTIYQVESSVQHDMGEATGMGSARVQHAFKVDMNEAARLQAGEAFLIRQRYAAKLLVSQVKAKEISEAPTEAIPPPQVKEDIQDKEDIQSKPRKNPQKRRRFFD